MSHSSWWRRVLVSVATLGLWALPVLVFGGLGGLLFLHDGREDIDLVRWVDPKDPWSQSVMPGARVATEELCTAQVPCIQAVQADTLAMYRFTTKDEAAAAARYFAGEGYWSNWIVVRFEPGALSADQRRDFVSAVDCTNTWSAGGGLDC